MCARDGGRRAAVARAAITMCIFAAVRADCVGTLVGQSQLEPTVYDATPATSAYLNGPNAVVWTPNGTYIADTLNHRIVLVKSDGNLFTVAGSGNSTFDPASSGSFAMSVGMTPYRLRVNSTTGDMLIMDATNVLLVDGATGILRNIAGNGGVPFDDCTAPGRDSQPAASCSLHSPSDALWLPTGDVLIGFGSSGVFQQVSQATGLMTDFAGGARASACTGANSTVPLQKIPARANQSWRAPTAVLSPDRTLLLANSRNVFIVSPDLSNGSVIAGNCSATGAQQVPVNGSSAFAVDFFVLLLCDARVDGTLLALRVGADTTKEVAVLILPDFSVLHIAGSGTVGYAGDGGPAVNASFNSLKCGSFTPDGVLLADSLNNAIRFINLTSGIVTTVAGAPQAINDGNPGTGASLSAPLSVELRSSGDIIIADNQHARVRLWSATTGLVSTLAGGGQPVAGGGAGAGGPATAASLSAPTFTTTDTDGAMIISDTTRVWRVDAATGVITCIIGQCTASCQPFSTDGAPAASLCLILAHGVTIGPAPAFDLYVADFLPSRVYRIQRSNMSVFAYVGTGNNTFNGDNLPGTSTNLYNPRQVAFHPTGLAFIPSIDECRIRVVTYEGIVSIYVGNGVPSSAGDGGPLSLASVNGPGYISFAGQDASLMLIPEWIGNRIRVVNMTARTIFTLAGSAGTCTYSGDAGPAIDASFCNPAAVLVDSFNNLVIADTNNNRVRVITQPLLPALPGSRAGARCPAGYVCSCGAPLLCSSPTQVCPANSISPRNVSAGYFAINSSTPGYTTQQWCPLGSYCVSGVRIACGAGTYGIGEGMSSQGACAMCPPGTYGTSSGATSAEQACVSCPPGTASADVGAPFCFPCGVGSFSNSSGALACAACSDGLTSLRGAAACVTIDSGSMSVGRAVVVQLAQPSADSTAATRASMLQLVVAIPMGVFAVLPVLVGFVLQLFGGMDVAARAPNGCASWTLALLRRLDRFALNKWVNDGDSLRKEHTPLGGAFTVSALGALCALASALIIQFIVNNQLTQQSLLLALTPTLLAAQSVPVMVLRGDSLASTTAHALRPSLSQGLQISMSVTGEPCMNLTWAASGLLAGAFVLSTVVDNGTYGVQHTLMCDTCIFGPQSNVVAAMDPACQSVLYTVGSVGALGDVFITQLNVSGSTTKQLASVHVTLTPTLQLYEDSISNVQLRGVAHAATLSNVTYGSAVTLTTAFNLAASDTYTRVVRSSLTTPLQLLASLFGLVSVIGAFGTLSTCLDRLLTSPPQFASRIKRLLPPSWQDGVELAPRQRHRRRYEDDEDVQDGPAAPAVRGGAYAPPSTEPQQRPVVRRNPMRAAAFDDESSTTSVSAAAVDLDPGERMSSRSLKTAASSRSVRKLPAAEEVPSPVAAGTVPVRLVSLPIPLSSVHPWGRGAADAAAMRADEL